MAISNTAKEAQFRELLYRIVKADFDNNEVELENAINEAGEAVGFFVFFGKETNSDNHEDILECACCAGKEWLEIVTLCEKCYEERIA